MIAAVLQIAADRGLASLSVADIVARSGVSRRTFYEQFSDREDCVLVTFEHSLNLARDYVAKACERAHSWREQIRLGLAALLGFLEDEPSIARLLILESHAAGPRAQAIRITLVERLSAILDEGRDAALDSTRAPSSPAKPSSDGAHDARQPPPPLTAEGIVGAVLGVIHNRLLSQLSHAPAKPSRPIALAGPLAAIVVLPYLGPHAAQQEIESPPQRPARQARPLLAADPLRDLQMRVTNRTVAVLLAIGAHPGASNRMIADAAGIADQGQISKLLHRLHRLELVQNHNDGSVSGRPNAWTLTAQGRETQDALAPANRG
jgi:AcrR family transcriptional regulator